MFNLSKPYKGTLDDWFSMPTDELFPHVIFGEHTRNGRTSYIRTSRVILRKGDEIETRNSRYTLGTPL